MRPPKARLDDAGSGDDEHALRAADMIKDRVLPFVEEHEVARWVFRLGALRPTAQRLADGARNALPRKVATSARDLSPNPANRHLATGADILEDVRVAERELL
jgi:hypothetical protein